MGGTYNIKNEENRVLFEMQFEKGWQPMPGKLWLKDYKWTLELNPNDGKYSIKTFWENNRKISKAEYEMHERQYCTLFNP